MSESTIPADTLASVSALNPMFRLRSTEMLRAAIYLPSIVAPAGPSDTSPIFTTAPVGAGQAYVDAGGVTYYLPTAEVSVRRATGRPQVAIVRRDGSHALTVEVAQRRPAGLPDGAQPLPLTGWQVVLTSPGTGQRFEFTVAELPPVDGDEADVVRRLACEVAVDPNIATTVLDTDVNATFSVTAEVAYRIVGAPAAPEADPLAIPEWRVRPDRFTFKEQLSLQPQVLEQVAEVQPLLRRAGFAAEASAVLNTEAYTALVAQPAPGPPSSHTARVELGAGMHAHFPREVGANRYIYSAVSGDFGVNPAAAWITTAAGEFVETPVLEQFYVLPDEYRLAFDLEHGGPAMSVLLVPKEAAAAPDPDKPQSFSRSYSVRVAFSIVPWVSPSRLVALRRIIADQTGIAFPQLVVGGIGAATFGLSSYFHDIGGSLVGGTGDTVAVDPHGFELVLDCTSEFYATIATQLIDSGFSGQVDLGILDAEGTATRSVTRRAELRLDRPDTSFLTQRLETLDDDPATPMTVVVANPSTVGVTIGSVLPTVVAYDQLVAVPVKAASASADPGSLTLAGGTDRVITIGDTGDVPWGGVVLTIDDVVLDLDATTVLGRAQDLGAVSGLTTSVHLVCYQLQHPEVLPEELADVHGLQIELRRTELVAPVTAFLTRDRPDADVQVAFTLTEVLAGASPEQPTFSWRRRNMTGAGNGPWSEWESITGRELYVTPVPHGAGG